MLHSIAFETLKRVNRNLKSLHRFRLNSVFDQSFKIRMSVKNENYQIETITDSKDLLCALKLRHKLEDRFSDLRFSVPSFIFTDEFDSVAEHILIRNLKNGQIIGGFRLLSSGFTNQLACETKFNLHSLKQQSLKILELSKLFIFPEHKHQDLMILATKFLSEYSLKSSDDVILSIQGINSNSGKSAVLMYQYFLSLDLIKNYYLAPPLEPYLVPNFDHWNTHFKNQLSQDELSEGYSLLPSIFRETLNRGATINGAPALDRQTNRIDFLTILTKDDLNRSLWKKSSYFSELHIAYCCS